MALFPRMTRPAIRITIEALQAYLPQLDAAGRVVANDVIQELQSAIKSANEDNRRRAQKESDATRL